MRAKPGYISLLLHLQTGHQLTVKMRQEAVDRVETKKKIFHRKYFTENISQKENISPHYLRLLQRAAGQADGRHHQDRQDGQQYQHHFTGPR